MAQTNDGGGHRVSYKNRAVRARDDNSEWKRIQSCDEVGCIVSALVGMAGNSCCSSGCGAPPNSQCQDADDKRSGEERNDGDDRDYLDSSDGNGIPSVSSPVLRALCLAAPFNSGRQPLTA